MLGCSSSSSCPPPAQVSGGKLNSPVIPGTRFTSMILYGFDYASVRPVNVIAKIAPRPIFLIQGAADTDILPSNMAELATAASAARGAHVQTWLVPHAHHIQAYSLPNAAAESP